MKLLNESVQRMTLGKQKRIYLLLIWYLLFSKQVYGHCVFQSVCASKFFFDWYALYFVLIFKQEVFFFGGGDEITLGIVCLNLLLFMNMYLNGYILGRRQGEEERRTKERRRREEEKRKEIEIRHGWWTTVYWWRRGLFIKDEKDSKIYEQVVNN